MSKKIIMCVDDEKMILDSLKSQLKKLFGNSYLYEFAESADEALEILDDVSPDHTVAVLVSDWLMPGMKGDELLIRVHKRFPATGKILLTGQADEAAIERVKALTNLQVCLNKPWSEKELYDIIQPCLE